MLTRRSLLLGSLAAGCCLSGVTFATNPTKKRTLLILLRGGLDGLSALVPFADPHYARARGAVALDTGTLTKLDSLFALHPALAPLLPLWRDGDLAGVHAVATAGGGRSHFDAQDVLDNGTEKAQGARTGWLNRAISLLDPTLGPPMALGRQVPLILRGDQHVGASDPLRVFEPSPALLDPLTSLYANDPQLRDALERGLDSQRLLDRHRQGRPGRKPLSPAAARLVGRLLAAEEGPRTAVLEVGGWDTHVRQAATLQRNLAELAEGILAIREGLGDRWHDTAVVVVSEFGRTVAGNGSGGTDHGTGGVVLLAGGAVQGGTVYGAWPGLSDKALLDGRDLRPTTDVRSLFKGLLIAHLGANPAAVERVVFPNTPRVLPLTELFG